MSAAQIRFYTLVRREVTRFFKNPLKPVMHTVFVAEPRPSTATLAGVSSTTTTPVASMRSINAAMASRPS